MQARSLAEDGNEHLARGEWRVGDEEFKRELLRQMEGRHGPGHYEVVKVKWPVKKPAAWRARNSNAWVEGKAFQ
jgi:hypothetical protein